MTSFQVTITNTHETFSCRDDTDVLRAMEQLQRKGIPVGCRNGGCGVCKVEVTAGLYAKRKMSRAVLTQEEEERGCVLACKISPMSDLQVRVVGKMVRAVEARKNKTMSFDFGFMATSQTPQPGKET